MSQEIAWCSDSTPNTLRAGRLLRSERVYSLGFVLVHDAPSQRRLCSVLVLPLWLLALSRATSDVSTNMAGWPNSQIVAVAHPQ